MYIDGFGVTSYKSFGDQLQLIGGFSKVNLIIGQNNTGKSNIITFLAKHYKDCITSAERQHGNIRFESIDRHLGGSDGRFTIAFGLKIGGGIFEQIMERLKDRIDIPGSRIFPKYTERKMKCPMRLRTAGGSGMLRAADERQR
jgi:AAA15 family ATPase/GTPase